MTRQRVRAILHADIVANPGDWIEYFSDAFKGDGNPVWPNETDLIALEPRPHFWNSFDTAWTVRAAFAKNERLIHHRLEMVAACGP